MSAPAQSSVSWFASVMLRDGGHIVMLEIECAFDESGTHAGSPTVCVAGYIMERGQARELEREWNAVLNWNYLPHPLRHFHMADCAPDPGNGEFDGLTKPQRIQIVSQMIGIIKRRTVMGIAVTVDVNDFNLIVAGHPFYPDPYVLAAHVALTGVFKWIEANKPDLGGVAYFFEDGHASEPDARALMDLLFRIPRLKDDYCYRGVAFVPKLGNPVVQAADLLAWQWTKDRKNAAEGRPRRKDLASLMIHRHAVAHIERPILEAMAETKESVTDHLLKIFGQEQLP